MITSTDTELSEIAETLITRCRATRVMVSAVVVEKEDSQPRIEVSVEAANLKAIIRRSTQPSERFYATDTEGNLLSSGPILLEKFSAKQIALMMTGWLIHNSTHIPST